MQPKMENKNQLNSNNDRHFVNIHFVKFTAKGRKTKNDRAKREKKTGAIRLFVDVVHTF